MPCSEAQYNNKNYNEGGPPSKQIRDESVKKVKYCCMLCGRGFGAKWILDRHVTTVHDKKKIKCDECDQEFSRYEYLQRHILAVHEERKYECPECDFVCSRKDNLLRHNRGLMVL